MDEHKEENFKEKMDKKIGVLLTYSAEGYGVVSMPVGKFPYDFWKEWEEDCKRRFNGIRWMKAWHDHQQVKQFNLQVEVEMLKSQLRDSIEKVEQEIVENNNPLGLLSGGK